MVFQKLKKFEQSNRLTDTNARTSYFIYFFNRYLSTLTRKSILMFFLLTNVAENTVCYRKDSFFVRNFNLYFNPADIYDLKKNPHLDLIDLTSPFYTAILKRN